MTASHLYRVEDPTFRRWFCRFAGWPSRYLARCETVIEHRADGVVVLHISNGLYALLSISWARQRASLLPGSALLSPDDLWGLDETLTIHVRRFLLKHRLIDTRGRSTRRHTA